MQQKKLNTNNNNNKENNEIVLATQRDMYIHILFLNVQLLMQYLQLFNSFWFPMYTFYTNTHTDIQFYNARSKIASTTKLRKSLSIYNFIHESILYILF